MEVMITQFPHLQTAYYKNVVPLIKIIIVLVWILQNKFIFFK